MKSIFKYLFILIFGIFIIPLCFIRWILDGAGYKR